LLRKNWSILWFSRQRLGTGNFRFPDPSSNFQISILLLFWLTFSACGYRFAESGDFPFQIRRICIPPLENRSTETGADAIFANHLISEFSRNSDLLLTNRDEADAVLSGKIRSVSVSTISRKGSHTSLERQIRITVDVELIASDEETLWSARGISEREAYAVESDKAATEHNRRQALLVVSERIAEIVYERLTNNF